MTRTRSYLFSRPLLEMQFLLLLLGPLQNLHRSKYLPTPPDPSIHCRHATGIFIHTTHFI
jgi:hypothetical protein